MFEDNDSVHISVFIDGSSLSFSIREVTVYVCPFCGQHQESTDAVVIHTRDDHLLKVN